MRFSILILFLTSVTFLPSPLSAKSKYEKQIEFEKKISDQISTKLSKVLAEDTYQIIVNGNLKVKRNRIKIEEQVNQKATGLKNKSKSNAPALPGFNVKRKEQSGGKNNGLSKTSNTKYKYVESTTVDLLDVYLVYSASLSEDRMTLATGIVEKHLQSSFGDRAKVMASVSDVGKAQGSIWERFSNWAANYLGLRGSTALDIIYLVAIGIVLLATVLAIWGHFWRKRRAAMNMAQKASASTEATARQREELELAKAEAKEAIAYIVDSLTKFPLVTQSFLRQLKHADKTTVLSYLHSPALNEYLTRILGLESLFRSDASEIREQHTMENTERLKTIVEDLRHYQKLQNDFNSQRFGYLNLIDPKVLHQYFSSKDDSVARLAAAAKYLPKPVYLDLTEQLSTADKAKLFQCIADQNTISAEQVDQMESELRDLYERQKKEMSCPLEAAQLKTMILDNDLNADKLISALQSQGVSLGENLEKYAVNMENILNQDAELLRQVLDELSNEDLAKAYAKQPSKYKLKEYMPENRFRLIDAMIARFHRIDDEQIKDAQLKVLGVYRLNV